jgi:type I restriction enzyme S subunit
MSEWKEYKLNDLVTKLGDGLHGTPKYDPEGDYYFINGSNLIDGKISVNDNTKRVSKAEFDKYKKELSDRTIFVSINGTLGNIATYNNEKIILGKSACYFNVKDGVCKEFIKYIATDKSFQHYISEYATGSTIKNVPLKTIRDYTLKLPSLPTQTAIAEILSSLDDKIELNNKINKELEDLAQTLFKRWFIDFEFPNENGEPYKSSGGEMVESELGEIPKGWEVKTLKDEFILNMGQSPNGDTYNTIGDGMIFFQGRSDFGFRFPSIRMYTNDPKKIAKKFETLISVRAPVGDINMASEDCCIGRGLGSISHIFKLYSYTYYKILSIQVELKSYDNEGTVFGSINKETLGNIKSIIPPIDICKSFNDLSVANDGLIFNMVNECQQLTNLRDTLLPKLISGELEVNNINF